MNNKILFFERLVLFIKKRFLLYFILYIERGMLIIKFLIKGNKLMVEDEIRKCALVPVVAVHSVDDGLRLCECLINAGLGIAEITFRTPVAEATIKAVSKAFPEMLIAAGTILNNTDMDRAFAAGAKFAVAPGCNPAVLEYGVSQNYAFFPGVSTPSELEIAASIGVRTFKFFPAEASGGVKMLKSLIGPYGHLGIQFCPTGGINEDNMAEYLVIPEVMAIGGSWMVSEKLIGNWSEMTRVCKQAVEKAKAIVEN